MSADRNNWLIRAALAAVHTMATSNTGYHPDTPVDGYDTPLDFMQMQFLHAAHSLLFVNDISVADEVVETGAWIIVLTIDSNVTSSIESGIIFGEDEARLLMLYLRDESTKDVEDLEPNEGRATVLEGKDTYITATDGIGRQFLWQMMRMAEPMEPKLSQVPDAYRP